MTSYSAPTQLLSEAQLLRRAGGRTAFVPGKGGSAGESSRKVGTGWNAIQPTSTKAATIEVKEEKVKVEIDDYEEDQEVANINPQRLNRNSRRPATRSSASRWASVMTERPTPSTSSATTPQPRPVPMRTASASRQPSGPPSPSQQKSSQNGFKFAPATGSFLGRPPSQPGTKRGIQPTGRLPSRPTPIGGGGTSASRWANATSANPIQDRRVSNSTKPPASSSRPATQKDLPPHVIAQPTPLPPKPQAQAPPRAPTPEIAPPLAKEPSPPPVEPSTPASFSQSITPPDLSEPSTTSTPPAPVAVESKPSSPTPSPKPRSPSPVSVSTPRAPSQHVASPPPPPPPVPVVESPALPVEPTREEEEEMPQLKKPIESENVEKARQESLSSSNKISKLVSPMHLEQLSPPSLLKPSAASRVAPPRNLLLPDRNRVASGGARKEKKTPEELEALMAQMRLKNEAALLKRAKAEEDRRVFEELAERERKASEELERKLREERERKIREEKERKERTLELQKEINRSREEAAQRKLALIEGRAWDAEKLSKDTRELQYPSFERRIRRESYDGEEGEEVVEDEEERRKKDGVRNDDGGWETVEHFEGKGRAQLVVIKGKEKEENGIEA